MMVELGKDNSSPLFHSPVGLIAGRLKREETSILLPALKPTGRRVVRMVAPYTSCNIKDDARPIGHIFSYRRVHSFR